MDDMADNIKLGVAALLAGAGIYGFYYWGDQSVLRVVSVVVGFLAGAALGFWTAPGQRFYRFSQEAMQEARKVSWPTRKETLQTTGVVLAFVVLMAVFMWVVDAGLLWVVKSLMGRES